MIEIEYKPTFLKAFKRLVKRSPNLKRKALKRIFLFQNNPFHNSLHSHKLTGRLQDFFSFSVTADTRVVYYWKKGSAVFIDIGTHDEVYKN